MNPWVPQSDEVRGHQWSEWVRRLEFRTYVILQGRDGTWRLACRQMDED